MVEKTNERGEKKCHSNIMYFFSSILLRYIIVYSIIIIIYNIIFG